MKNLMKLATCLVLILAMVVASIVNVKAIENTISIGPGRKVDKQFIAGRAFAYKQTTDGRYLYCLEEAKQRVSSVTANLVSNSNRIDGGIVYILKNGFPEKSITGDNDKDYYITQTAIWWYFDSTRGTSNLNESFKSTGAAPYDMRKLVKNLVNAGIAHRYDKVDESQPTLTLTSGSTNSMSLENNYYITNSIKATSTGITEYTVTIENPVKGTIIVPSNGQEFNYSNSFKIGANDTFKIKVPASSITEAITLKVNASANGNTIYKAYEYQPTNTKMQNVALLEKTPTSIKTSTTFTIATTRLTIKKIDESTNKPLAGAVLVLKNAEGKEITRWTSTVNEHIIENIAPGTYTVEEVAAPEGYRLNKTPATVKITTNQKVYAVVMKNSPKNIVININKLDNETRKNLAGAVLVIKDCTGTIVERFVTEEKAHVITDIKYGTYTVEEESAPTGYIKSNEKIKFTVDDNHQSHQITITNTKETKVPDTGTESIIFALIGIIILGIGLDFILKNAKA